MPESTAQPVLWSVDSDVDRGYFGPGSLSWKILSAPAVPLMIAQITNLLEAPHIDFQSVLLDHDPLYPTNAKKQRSWTGDPAKKGGRITDRLRRTVAGPLPIIFGDTVAARRCADRLAAYHRPMTGINADDGQPYSAVDPDTMLFAAVTIAHGALIAYERYAFRGWRRPRRLPPHERDQFFRETAELAVLMGVPRERVPVTARQVADFYRSQAPKYRTRKGYFLTQLRTAATQLRFTTGDTPATMAADLALLGTTFLAYSVIPRPCRREHRIPAPADPLLSLVHLASLPAFGLLQIEALGAMLVGAFLGEENFDGIRRSQAAAPVTRGS
ncbi:oxygenase MpaB family protein [Mycolicibacterium vaccae]|uniref:oxygenase MpaB family protein n=1 Tax=Mycolicibacterium vaccae TaxID=1810 RepID=UPI003D02D936